MLPARHDDDVIYIYIYIYIYIIGKGITMNNISLDRIISFK